ncbi:MAG: single-stranded DNA-binding protein [Longicatena sp.]
MYNRTVLLGRLTKDPNLEKTKSGKSAVTFTVACGYGDNVDFIKCKAYDKTAENLCKYQRKGNLILVEAAVKTYVKEIDNERTYYQDIVANHIQFAESKNYADDEVAEEVSYDVDDSSGFHEKNTKQQEDEGLEM